MTAVILASGTARGPSQGLAAAVAVETAVLTGASTLLMEVGEGARRRGPTLLASPGAREAEEALRSAGLRASARGHVCHLAIAGGASVEDVADAVAGSGAELAVVHLPGRLWVPALEAEPLFPVGGCLLLGGGVRRGRRGSALGRSTGPGDALLGAERRRRHRARPT